MGAADRFVHGGMLARQKAAVRRADDVIRRIERGGVDPRPLPGLREDSMESMPSMESSPSMASIEPAETASGVTGEADDVQEDSDLEERNTSPKGRDR
jgi:hypothetical protein